MTVLLMAIMTTSLMLIIVGLFMLVRSINMLRVLLAAEVILKAALLLMIFAGHANGNMVLAQTYMVTVIVLEVVLLIVASGLIISIFHKTGSMDLFSLQNIHKEYHAVKEEGGEDINE